MGAWGSGSFDNDDALDWAGELERSEDLSAIIRALDAVTDTSVDYLETPDCSAALAAAEVVAGLTGSPSPSLPENIIEWLGDHDDLSADADAVTKARQAVDAILRGSELRELWEETDEFEEWRTVVIDLLDRLVLGSQGTT